MKYLYWIIVICTFATVSTAQPQRKNVVGKVVSKSRNLEDIYVQNKSTGTYTLTERGGYFKILAQPEDTLVFSGVNFKTKSKTLSYKDLNKTMVFVPMEVFSYELDEIVIDRTVTMQSLGIPTGKVLTPAQRRLRTATSSSGGIIPVDAIINAISGRTKMLKKALEYDEEYLLVERVLQRFSDDYYTSELKISQNYILAFGYYLIQDKEVLESISNKNDVQVRFLYAEKATEFLELIKVLH